MTGSVVRSTRSWQVTSGWRASMSPALVRTATVAVLVAAQVLLGLAVFAGRSHAEAAPTWGWPLAGRPTVDRGFEPPSSAWAAGHRGVDLRGELGASVLAARAGRVTYAGLLAGRGVVTVAHADGLRTTYEPVEPSVSVGESVALGEVLGTLDTGHGSCHPGTVCLHWGLLRGDTYLDPLALVTAGRLRLLPVVGAPRAPAPAARRAPVPRREVTTTPAPATVSRTVRESTSPVLIGVANIAGTAAVGYLLILCVRRLRRLRPPRS